MAEEIERVTDDQISSLRRGFHEKIVETNADFCSQDLERVKTDDLWMRRFVAAQEMNIKDATNMLYETCQWRKEFGVNELDHTKLKPKMIEKGSLFIRNKDNWGKSLLIFKAKNHTKGSDDMEDLKKFIVYYFERIERLTKSDQISVIFDMKDTGWSNMDMDFIRYLITLLKQYYPYFVNYLMIFEMPWLLKSAWNIIKGWLPPKFVDRVKFVDKKTISEFINRENQLVEWGGTDEYSYSFEPEIQQKSKPPPLAPATTKTTNLDPAPEIRKRKTEIQSTTTSENNLNGNITPTTPRMKAEKITFESFDGESKHQETVKLSSQKIAQHQSPSQQEMRRSNYEMPIKHAEVESTIILRQQSGEISGQFLVTNIMGPGQTILYKVKTINPEDFKVRPSVGLLPSETQGRVSVTVHQGIDTRHLARAKFQVLVLLVPENLVTDELLQGHDYTKLNTFWKSLERGAERGIQQERISVVLDSSILPTSSNGGSLVTMNEAEMKRSLKDFENRLRERVKEDTNEAIDKVQTKLYFFCMLFGVFMLFHLLFFGGGSVVCSNVEDMKP